MAGLAFAVGWNTVYLESKSSSSSESAQWFQTQNLLILSNLNRLFQIIQMHNLLTTY